MAQHTPGPWEVGPVDDTVVTHVGVDGVRYEVAAIDGDYNQPETWPVMEANARLISAAPDMLAALKAMDAALCDGFETAAGRLAGRKALIAARAAIAKAEHAREGGK